MLLRQKCAFTLAEVLIVLSIIGIVSAMTIPNLMTKIQDMEFKTAAKKAYSVTSEAIKKMNYDNETTNRDYFACQTLKPNLIKYFKVLGSWGGSEYGLFNADKIQDNYKNLSDVNYFDSFRFDDGQFLTNDGMFYMFENCGGSLFVSVDVNGPYKKPNVLGRDVFSFQLLDNNKFLPMGADGTDYPASTYCNRKNNTANQGMGCMYYVMQGVNY